MAGADAVVVGSANADLVLRVERRPEPGETLIAEERVLASGGKGANQAVAAARAGANVAFVGCLGGDEAGGELRRALVAAGVGVELVRTVEEPTGTAFVTVTPDGENAIVVSRGANAAVDRRTVEAASGVIAGAAVLAVQLEIPLESVRTACELARRAGTAVVLSAAPADPEAAGLLPLADVVVCNLGEARVLAAAPAAAAREAATALRRGGVPAVVVTLGADGALLSTAEGEEIVPAFRAGPTVDTTGAGDALAGVLTARLAAGDELRSALALAVVAAGLSVTRAGAQPSLPALAEIRAASAR